MEIFIVGVFVVALMVYVSTKIKRSAAAAFEREEIDEEDFSLIKPEGYIHPFNENSPLAFEVYSKDFGDEEAKNFRRSRATLRVVSGSDFEAVCRSAKKTAGKIRLKRFVEDAPANQKIFLLENEKSENDVRFFTRWKIVESRERGKIYEFQVSVLEQYEEEFADAASEMIRTFSVK
jgi:hypothetical protein